MKSILIVDDSRVSRKILKNMLEQNGYTIAGEAANGKEGVELYKQLKPDIVTMDITMPEMNGLESLKLIKEFDPDAKIVIITAAGQLEKRELAIEYGASGYVTKPYENQEILDAIANV
ncbi:MAG: response regulator [Butyrivibrio sp.]|nr:response regulator [Butyrivibrio sp.]